MVYETTGTDVAVALAVVKTLVLIVGGVITYVSFKAYRRTRQRPLGLLSAGFGIVTLGVALAGVSYELIDADIEIGILLESVLVLVGFCVIAYSLYAQ